MTKATEIEESTIKTTFELPKGVHDQVVGRVATLMAEKKITVTKTDVLIELIKIGLQKVNNAVI